MSVRDDGDVRDTGGGDGGPVDGFEPCCDDGPTGHTEQQHHDASPCYDSWCGFVHPRGGPFRHPCDAQDGDA